MAKKTHVKVRMVPEAKPDSPYFYYLKNQKNKKQTLELHKKFGNR